MADLHIGDPQSDYKSILERIEYIRKTPNAYCILDGDLMDTAIASSIGDTYSANLQPMEQLKQCVKIFEPIKEKILAVLPGNHENRVYKSDGIDMTEIMCNQMGLRSKNLRCLLSMRPPCCPGWSPDSLIPRLRQSLRRML